MTTPPVSPAPPDDHQPIRVLRGPLLLLAAGLLILVSALTHPFGSIPALLVASAPKPAPAVNTTVTAGATAGGGSGTEPGGDQRSAGSNSPSPAPRNGPEATLPPTTAADVAAIASRVLTADLTGIGRGEFPGYWPGEPDQAACRAVQVTSTAVHTNATGDLADVTLLWTGTRTDGTTVDDQPATVRLHHTDGTWTPVHPWND